MVKDTARQVLEIVPLVMRNIRSEFRAERSRDLSIAQFRALAYINNNDGVSLSSLAAHIGISLPSMSKSIDGLVGRGLVLRSPHREDRRRICLQLTAAGKDELKAAYSHTETFLVEKISGLVKQDLDTLQQSMRILGRLFAAADPHNTLSTTKE